MNLIIALCLGLLVLSQSVVFVVKADEYVDAYVKTDGTVVNGYWKSDADDDITNNLTTPTTDELTDYYLEKQKEWE